MYSGILPSLAVFTPVEAQSIDLYSILEKLPPTTQAIATSIPGTLHRVSRVDNLEGKPIDLQIHVNFPQPNLRVLNEMNQRWQGLLLVGENDVRCDAIRTVISKLSQNQNARVLVLDPAQFALGARWDVAAIAPRAMSVGEDYTLENIKKLIKEHHPDVIVLVWCVGSEQIPVAKYILEQNIRVVYDVAPMDEPEFLPIPRDQQLIIRL